MMRSKLSAVLARIFYAMFALSFTWLALHIVVGGGYYEYREVRLLLYTLCALALFLLVWRLAKKYEAVLAKYAAPITIGFLVLMFEVQIVFGLLLRYQPIFDIDAVYGAAVEWVETGTFASYYEYYAYFFNNFGALRFYYVVFRLARALGSTDYFMAATMANGLLSLAAMYVTGAVGQRLLGTRGRMAAYALFLLSPPFWFLAPAFYTDALSMLFPVLLYWLYLLAKGEDVLWKRLVLYLLMGLTASLGIQIKPTVAIAFVAIVIDAALTWKWKRLLPMAAVVLAVALLGQVGLRGTIYRHLDREEAAQKSTPVLHWVMMGLKGNGMYNPGDYEFTRSFDDLDERDEALRAEIADRLRELGPGGLVRLFTVKSDICFGDGTYGLSDCLGGTREKDTRLHEWLLSGGTHYETYRHICMGVLMAVYLLMIAGGWHEVFTGDSGSLAAVAPRLAVFGLLLFLLGWEARWRYFSNYIPLIFVSALLGLEPFSRAATCLGRRLGPARSRGSAEESSQEV